MQYFLIFSWIAHWGPGLYGEFTWERFTQFVKAFGNYEGLKVINLAGKTGTKEEILTMILETAIDWQEDHPAINFGQKKENYGLKAFQQFIKDLSDKNTRSKVNDAYINCHVILDIMRGRYWLGSYLNQLADQFETTLKTTLNDIGSLYKESSNKLKQFIDYNIKEKSENEITEAVALLEEAYGYEKEIVENFKDIRDLLN